MVYIEERASYYIYAFMKYFCDRIINMNYDELACLAYEFIDTDYERDFLENCGDLEICMEKFLANKNSYLTNKVICGIMQTEKRKERNANED